MTETEPTTAGDAVPVRTWWRRRAYLIAAAGAATAALLVLVISIAWPEPGGPGPEDVVREYLDAIRSGDLETALRAGGRPDPDRGEDTFLIAEALSGDWEIDRIVRRYPGQDVSPATVDVTITASDGTAGEGRFHLTEGDAGWSIDDPYVGIRDGSVRAGFADFIELEGVVRPAVVDPFTTYLLLPGAYRIYPSLAGLVVAEPATIIALPGHDPSPPRPATFELTGAGQDAVQRAVDARIDTCAAGSTPDPGCPFSADGDGWDAMIGDHRYDEVEELTWEVVSYPEVLLGFDGQGYAAIERRPGTVRVTGTGVRLSDDRRRSFDAECGIDLSFLRISLTASGEFALAGERDRFSTCRT